MAGCTSAHVSGTGSFGSTTGLSRLTAILMATGPIACSISAFRKASGALIAACSSSIESMSSMAGCTSAHVSGSGSLRSIAPFMFCAAAWISAGVGLVALSISFVTFSFTIFAAASTPPSLTAVAALLNRAFEYLLVSILFKDSLRLCRPPPLPPEAMEPINNKIAKTTPTSGVITVSSRLPSHRSQSPVSPFNL